MTNIFKSSDKLIQHDLSRIEQVLMSPNFLSGLTLNSNKNQLAQSFTIIDNIMDCHERIGSESVYDLPKPWPYQCFNEILDEENGRITYQLMPANESIKLKRNVYTPNIKIWNKYGFKALEKRYLELNVADTLEKLTKHYNNDLKGITWVYEFSFQSVIDAIFSLLIRSACIGGFKSSPISERMLQAFEAGGIPGGWVGPLPHDGGKAQDCLQLFHLGDCHLS